MISSMTWRHIEGEAEYVLRSANLADFVRVPVTRAIEAVLGPDSLEIVPRRQLGGASGITRVENNRQVIRVAAGDICEIRFIAAHELGHIRLRHGEHRHDQMEAEADRFAAALLMPWTAFRVMQNELEGDIEALAEVFQVTQTAVALRLGEVGDVAAVVVVTPDQVRLRSLGPFDAPSEQDWRDYARMTEAELERVGPGLRKAELTDGRRRVALVVDEEAG